MKWKKGFAAFVAALFLPVLAAAQEYDAQLAHTWLSGFCQEIAALEPLGDSTVTVDPSRPGEYLQEYAFGTVTATRPETPIAEEIVEVDIRTNSMADCRQMRVGMTLDDVLAGEFVGASNTQLYVLGTQDAGLGFHWAYLGEDGVYGVEYVTYGAQVDGTMTEYTLTYMIDAAGIVEAIRLRCAKTTEALAIQACDTADEIAVRQRGEVVCVANDRSILTAQELTISDIAVLGMPVSDLVSALGEPLEVQTLVGVGGRILLYEGAMIEVDLNVQTGEEVVCGVRVSNSGITGPRALRVGMSVQEAASLFACEQDVYAVGGMIYGSAESILPCAVLSRGETQQEWTLRYMTRAAVGAQTLEIIVYDQMVTTWRLY